MRSILIVWNYVLTEIFRSEKCSLLIFMQSYFIRLNQKSAPQNSPSIKTSV